VLIIDVARTNGGGRHQSTLQAIYGFFLPGGFRRPWSGKMSPRIGEPRFKGNHIAYRPKPFTGCPWNAGPPMIRNEIQSVAEELSS